MKPAMSHTCRLRWPSVQVVLPPGTSRRALARMQSRDRGMRVRPTQRAHFPVHMVGRFRGERVSESEPQGLPAGGRLRKSIQEQGTKVGAGVWQALAGREIRESGRAGEPAESRQRRRGCCRGVGGRRWEVGEPDTGSGLRSVCASSSGCTPLCIPPSPGGSPPAAARA